MGQQSQERKKSSKGQGVPSQALWWLVQHEPPLGLLETSVNSWGVGRGSHLHFLNLGCVLCMTFCPLRRKLVQG